MTIVFLDTEFTSPQQQAELISLVLVTDDGRELYEELSDYRPEAVSSWVREHVFPHLGDTTRITHAELSERIREFLSIYEYVELWADCCSYDWVLFCELFGGPGGLPQNISGRSTTRSGTRGWGKRVSRSSRGPLPDGE